MKKLDLVSTFGSQSHKNEGNSTAKKRGILFVILLMAFGLSLFAQTFQTNRYYQVILKVDGVETKLSQHTTQLYAENKLNCRDGYIIPPIGKVLGPATLKCPEPCPPSVNQESLVDRMTLDVHVYGNVTSPTGAVFTDCCEIYIVTKLPTQVIPDGTFTTTLQRTKNFKEAKTTYEVISMEAKPLPAFRVVRNEVSLITSTTARIDIDLTKKQSKIIGYLNGVQYIEFNPGSSFITPQGNWTYLFGYKELIPNTMYEVYTKNISIDGEITESASVMFKTL